MDTACADYKDLFGDEERRIVTHGAVIVLAGDRAWKFKRPVRFRYLDFSTVDLRHDALAAELRLNRRTAPEIYRELHAIRRDADGALSLDGPGETIDWVLEMARFADDALAVEHLEDGRLDDETLQRLARQVVDLHRVAEVCADHGGAARIQEVVDGNLQSMLAFDGVLDAERAHLLTDRLTAIITAHAALLDERATAGRVRHGHGDLHLGNIAIVDGTAVPFDCLEFDDDMATTDVLYDLAFLAMDLWARGARHEANVVVNAYLDLSPADEHGFCLMPLFLAVRATVRAHVGAAGGDDDNARAYLKLALDLTAPAAPTLCAIGGGSGTGKSTRARAIGGDIKPAPGARILRSDVLRKRLAGVDVETRLPASSYTREASDAVYGEIMRLAAIDLTGGMSVIADAVFGRASERDEIARVASSNGCAFTGIWLELSEAQRIARIEARGPDASDADATVARIQTDTIDVPKRHTSSAGWRIVDAANPADQLRKELNYEA